MKVAKHMTRDVVTIDAEDPVAKALERMSERAIRHLPVMDRGRLVGIVSERDLLEATGWDPARAVDHEEGRARAVRDVMSVWPKTAAPDDDLTEAARRLVQRKIGCLPVLEGERVVGLLSDTDVLAAFVETARGSAPDGPRDPLLEEVAVRNPLTVGSDVRVASAWELARRSRVRHLPVVEEGWFVGLVSDRDLRLWIGKGRGDDAVVGDVMAKHVVTLDPRARLSEAASRMLADRIGCVPVTAEGLKLLGLVTTEDVLAHCAAVPEALGGASAPR